MLVRVLLLLLLLVLPLLAWCAVLVVLLLLLAKALSEVSTPCSSNGVREGKESCWAWTDWGCCLPVDVRRGGGGGEKEEEEEEGIIEEP